MKEICILKSLIVCLFFYNLAIFSVDFEYGRIGISSPSFTIGKSENIVDQSNFYRHISKEACERRSKVLKKEEKNDEGGKGLNIATFAIEFFDDNGTSILEKPVFFGHPVKEEQDSFLEKIKKPHFFLSGRHAREYIGDDVSSLGLSERSPTEVFLKLKLAGDESKDANVKQKISDFRHYFLSVLPFEKIWFDRLVDRAKDSKSSQDNFDKIMMCSHERPAGHCMLKQSDERLFTHSEQLALALMQDESYDNNIYKLIENIQKHQNIKNSSVIVFHIYTYNTMCARCARSIYYDFRIGIKLQENLKKFFGKHMPIRFIIAATKEYTDTLHRNGEPKSSDTSPNDCSSSLSPIPFYPSTKLQANDYLYQWIITPKSEIFTLSKQLQSFFDGLSATSMLFSSVGYFTYNYLLSWSDYFFKVARQWHSAR